MSTIDWQYLYTNGRRLLISYDIQNPNDKNNVSRLLKLAEKLCRLEIILLLHLVQ